MDTLKLAASLKVSEGTGPMRGGRYFPYRDTVGKLTISYGRNLDDVGLSGDEAEYLLASDILNHTAEVRAAFPWFDGLNDVRQRVVVEMAFNMGLGNSHAGLLSFHHTLTCIAQGDYALAADAMLQSQWATQVKGRAIRLSVMMRTGEDQP